ncbi:MAG: metallophosphoesterase family protein [Selenomonadaceae bacterium]|nr:metallophosphoesterase family protein [Selenomonadaceae bacterium]
MTMNVRMMNRRKFIKAAIGSGFLLASGNIFSGCGEVLDGDGTTGKSDKIADLEVNHLRQIITSNANETRCIMWQSNDILMNPAVEVKANDLDNTYTFAALDCSFTDDDHINNQYSARVEGLNVGTSYQYRIVDGDHCSAWHNLKTTEGKSFKALIFPDSQCADYSVWSKVAKSAYSRNEDAAFFVNVGDIVDNGEDWTQWKAWFEGASTFLDKIPFVPIMGNHECYNRQWQTRLPEAYLKYFEVPSNGNEKFERRYYSFDYGDVHFAILDSQWDELNTINSGAGDELIRAQQEWLRRDMSNTSKKWKIVFIHKDVLQYRIKGRPERLEGFSDIGTLLMPLFDELKIDIVFTAHLHTYRDRGHIYNFEHNPNGSLYILTGLAGDVRYPGLWIDHALDVAKAPQPETDNYLTLEAAEDKIEVKCFLPDGTEIDRAVVKQGEK